MASDFAWELKEKGNWQIVGQGKNKIDNLAKPVHDYNTVHQNNKTSQKAALRRMASKWRTKRANYIG